MTFSLFMLAGIGLMLALGLIVIPNTGRRAIVDDLKTAATGFLDAPTVHLFVNDYTPTPLTVVADLTEAAFSGYAAVVGMTWDSTFTNSLNQAVIVGDSVQFNHNGGAVGETVYGYYLTDAAGAVLMFAERFETPISMTKLGDAVPLVPVFTFGQ